MLPPFHTEGGKGLGRWNGLLKDMQGSRWNLEICLGDQSKKLHAYRQQFKSYSALLQFPFFYPSLSHFSWEEKYLK